MKKIDPNKLKVRDSLMVRLICGATKAGVQTDKKKKLNKQSCRKWKEESHEDPDSGR